MKKRKEKNSTSEKIPGRAVIKDWQFYLVCKIKFSIFIHSLKNNLFRYKWVGIILSVLSVAKDSGDWTWKWAPHISHVYHWIFFFSWDLLGRIPWNKALDRTRAQESWLFFRGRVFRAQEWTIPNKRRLSEIAGGLIGWKRSSQQNSTIKKVARCESKDKGPGGNMQTLSMQGCG